MIDLPAARSFVHRNARLVDRAHLAHLLGEGSRDAVLRALAAHANDDGGFGQALECDLRTAANQPIAVLGALDLLHEIGAGDSALIAPALDWLATVTNPDGGVPFVTAGAADGPHAPFLPTDPGGPSSFHMTAAVTGAAQRLAAGRAHPWTAAAAAYCWEHLPRNADSAFEIRYALDFLDGAEDRGRADAALEALRPLVPPDRPLPVSGGTADEVLPLTVLTPRPDRPIRALFDPAAVERALDAVEAEQLEDGGWDFDWLHWDEGVAWETRGRVTVHAIALLRANGQVAFRRIAAPQPQSEKRVEPLELFFDLVFVFALTQVTARLAHDLSWGGLLRGMLVLASIWWAWAAYAWLTNEVDSRRWAVRLAIFGSMIAMLIASLAVPGAFEGDALLFACAYLGVRLMHIGLFAAATEHVDVRQAARALAVTATFAPLLLIVGALLDETAQTVLWLVALAIDFVGGGLRGIGGWRLSPGHFAERHGLIVIIALGESIVAIGVGAEGIELGAGELLAAALGVVIAAALWWTYFDDALERVEARLHALPIGLARNRVARDTFSFLHLPLVAGIVLLALGARRRSSTSTTRSS